jgi:hypothetical protein
MTRVALILLVATLLVACVPPRKYDWNNYDASLYQYYKDPASAEKFRVGMEAHFTQLEARGQKPAPGLYAELGTLYLERGDRATAATYYAKERDAWPESRYLMDTMLQSLEKSPRERTGK